MISRKSSKVAQRWPRATRKNQKIVAAERRVLLEFNSRITSKWISCNKAHVKMVSF